MSFFKIQNVYFSQIDSILNNESEFEINFNVSDTDLLKLH